MPRRFEKSMTRSGAVMIFEVWSRAAESCYSEFGVPSALLPAEVLVNQRGEVSEYIDPDAIGMLPDAILRTLAADPDYFHRIFDEYSTVIDELLPMWDAGGALSREEFTRFLDVFSRGWRGLEWAYYVPTIEQLPLRVRERALELRHKGERFMDASDVVIRKSLAALYPGVANVDCLTREEFEQHRVPDQELLNQRSYVYTLVNGKMMNQLEVDAFGIVYGDATEGVVYEPGLTREGPLVCFQYESIGDEAAYVDIGMPAAARPVELIYCRDGLFTCCFRFDADRYFFACNATKAKNDPGFYSRMFAEYGEILDALERVLAFERVLNRSELLDTLALEKRSCQGLFHSYCLPNVAEAPASIKDIALTYRKREDRIGSRVRALIRQSLEALYPDHPLVRFASHDEIVNDRIPTNEILEQRQRECCIVDGELLEGTIDTFLQRTGATIHEEKVHATKEIAGRPAFSGIVRGSVRVVTKFEQFHTFQDGEILVTFMTTPNYLPLLKKAAGFITDEGGITCHAAIVSRELKKPCIIGTKIATKVLKDGDVVEVDAEKGVVKILKRA